MGAARNHAGGRIITYDTKTKALFTSDLFGSFSKTWDLYIKSLPGMPYLPGLPKLPDPAAQKVSFSGGVHGRLRGSDG
ncbi:MAG TPA: hypothetical protein PKL55_09925, partial [Syntrophales bacterium]|nr:hypothetical protein [Syntrophales bacterium]